MSHDDEGIRPFDSEGRLAVPGGAVWYGIAGHLGEGATPLLCLHGGPGLDHRYFLPLTDLAEARPVILYDQLDCGRSDHPGDPGNWTVGRFLDEIDAVRAGLGLDRVAVYGHSWGGLLAAAYGARRPEGLSALVIASPLISTARMQADMLALRDALPDGRGAVMRACEAAGRFDDPAYLEADGIFDRRHVCIADPWPRYLVESVGGMNHDCFRRMFGRSNVDVTGTMAGYDGTPELGRIAAPTLFTCGRADFMRPETVADFAAQVPAAELEVYEAASHLPMIELRAAHAESLSRFLRRHDG